MISESILAGEAVRLRPVQQSDLAYFQRMLADDKLRRWLGSMPQQPTMEEEQEWYLHRRQDPDSVLWSIETASGDLLGTAELRLNAENSRAEVGIGIFDRRNWGKGYGTAAMRLVLDYAFGELRLNRIELTTDVDNARAIRSYEKCGFVREGLLRQFRMAEGEPVDCVAMAVLHSDWQAAR